MLADTGYANLDDIQQIQSATPTRCYIFENDAPLAPIAKGRYRKDKDAYIDIYRGTD